MLTYQDNIRNQLIFIDFIQFWLKTSQRGEIKLPNFKRFYHDRLKSFILFTRRTPATKD